MIWLPSLFASTKSNWGAPPPLSLHQLPEVGSSLWKKAAEAWHAPLAKTTLDEAVAGFDNPYAPSPITLKSASEAIYAAAKNAGVADAAIPGWPHASGSDMLEKLRRVFDIYQLIEVDCPGGADYSYPNHSVPCPFTFTNPHEAITHLNDNHSYSFSQIADFLESLDIDLSLKAYSDHSPPLDYLPVPTPPDYLPAPPPYPAGVAVHPSVYAKLHNFAPSQIETHKENTDEPDPNVAVFGGILDEALDDDTVAKWYDAVIGDYNAGIGKSDPYPYSK